MCYLCLSVPCFKLEDRQAKVGTFSGLTKRRVAVTMVAGQWARSFKRRSSPHKDQQSSIKALTWPNRLNAFANTVYEVTPSVAEVMRIAYSILQKILC